ncbi:ArsR/SmtB family transcription factor [Nocardia crassostreae]|uniref:ArsR/SmtB family transcription factor n=1 Tax=Nocardia crassostreae TaxID=53428 RepID=UPI000835E9D4|nr:metalloregulator ArsR/SmtB family transcription factor [Nocardia crassostreae]
MPKAGRLHLTVVPSSSCGATPLTRAPLSAAAATTLAPAFAALSDPLRLRILSMIAAHQGGETCECDLTTAFNAPGPTLTYHLRILREAGLLSRERRGPQLYYRIEPEVLHQLSQLLGTTLDSVFIDR